MEQRKNHRPGEGIMAQGVLTFQYEEEYEEELR